MNNYHEVQVPYFNRFKHLENRLKAIKEGCEKGIPEEFWCDDCKRVLVQYNEVSERLQKAFIKKIKPILDKVKGVV